MCAGEHVIIVGAKQFDAWKQGALIQDAFPDLGDDERELLISGVCGKCFDSMFEEERENE